MEDRGQRRQRGGRRPRRKVCAFCAEKAVSVDYKDTAKLKRFITAVSYTHLTLPTICSV